LSSLNLCVQVLVGVLFWGFERKGVWENWAAEAEQQPWWST